MAGIIKSSGRTTAPAAVAPQAYQFQDVGQSYLERVKADAARLVAEARREAAQIRAKAADEGKAAALKAVEAAHQARLDQQLQSALAALQKAAHEITQARHAWQQHWEQHLVELALRIATRLCRRELARDSEITLAWIREALELAAGSSEITLRLHPQDQEALATRVAALSKAISGLGPVHVVADSQITSGGCRVETAFGSVDQQLEAQAARIAEELLG
jgi:flagellar assembly protein FliH